MQNYTLAMQDVLPAVLPSPLWLAPLRPRPGTESTNTLVLNGRYLL
jgi:hypothetical protein